MDQVTFRKSGPALTLKIYHATLGLVDVDLVPTFRFPIEYIKNHPRIEKAVKESKGVCLLQLFQV